MFTDPAKNLRAFALREDMIVADLGAGTGYYSILAGAMVPMGRVYAVEVERDYLTTIKDRAAEACLSNIECLWGNVEKIGGTKIKNEVIDKVIASNILFQVENKEKFIEEMRRILKPGGQVLLVDWSPEPDSIAQEHPGAIKMSKARDMFLERGFIFRREIDAGAHHYGMILEKQK